MGERDGSSAASPFEIAVDETLVPKKDQAATLAWAVISPLHQFHLDIQLIK